MKNLKKGDLVLLKNGDKSEIFSVFEKYKESSESQEYIYELITLDRKVLDEEYSCSDLVNLSALKYRASEEAFLCKT